MTTADQLAALASLRGTGKLTPWEDEVFVPTMQQSLSYFTPRQTQQITRLYEQAQSR